MVNFDGDLLEKGKNFLNHENRGLKYGDGLFETLRVVNGKVFFWEDHYFRLMSSMRILRMEIPMKFTLEFLEEEILKTVDANGLAKESCRVRITVFRKGAGLYTPEENNISYIIESSKLDGPFYILSETPYEIELFKDYYINADMLSNLKTTNKIINVVAGVFASENNYDNCLLLNSSKQVVETINGNIFLVVGNLIKTPPLKDGCLDGILRKKIIGVLEKDENYDLMIESISPFELQKADELFTTNSISGIQTITKYRKKTYSNKVSQSLIGKVNALARLS